jgi:hypothetical protein
LAQLIAEARLQDVVLEVHSALPADRVELLQAQQVRAALLPAPADQAHWSVPLGLAGDLEATRVYLATLRPPRTAAANSSARKIWIQPEDDVPHIRDPLTRLRDAVGLRPTQVAIAPDLTTAVAETLCSGDLLLCSPDQANDLALTWRPLGDLTLTRGFVITAAPAVDVGLFHTHLADAVARALGAPR